MTSKFYTNPKEAYEFMNSWTQMKTSYETQFKGKEIKVIKILMEGEKPTIAMVHYEKGIHKGMDTIDLSSKIPLSKQEKTINLSKF